MFNSSLTVIYYRLNPIYAIKECSTCGVWYTADFCCSKKGLEDKILVPKPPRNCARCARCGTPVDGPNCQGCALLRKKFKEDLFTYCVENEFFKDLQNTSESSNDNTNVVNAPQEPFVMDSFGDNALIVSLDGSGDCDPEVGIKELDDEHSFNNQITISFIEPDSAGDLTSIDLGIRKNVSTTNVNVPLEDDQSSSSLMLYGSFLLFHVFDVFPYLLSPGIEDTFFDPGISRIVKTLVLAVFHKSFTSSASFWESSIQI
ncbi:hypothetical protein Tco_0299404 [Tanacetum coccineum]